MDVGSNTDVCVVGAGVAGLAAADAVAAAGLHVVVIEASSRVGGRACTIRLGTDLVNPGAHWIHHRDQNPLSSLCDTHGLERVAFDLDDLTASQQLHDSHRLSGDEATRVCAVEDAFWTWFDPSAASNDASMREVVEDFFAARADESDAHRARLIVTSSIETELCASLDEIAVSNFDACTKPYSGGDDVIVGGYGRLVDVLASGIEIRTEREVRRISQHDATVTVGLSDGSEVHAVAAIVTVPLGVLKVGSIRFDPALPARMTSAIDLLGFGVFEKVFLQFAHRWWTASEEPNGLYLLDEDVYRYWLDITATVKTPTLVAHIAGPAANGLSAASQDRIANAVTALRRGLRVDVPEPIAAYATDWRHHPWTEGAYTRLRPGVPRTAITELTEPHGRVLFAGEHTSPARYGYVDGAYTSGLRAGQQAIALVT